MKLLLDHCVDRRFARQLPEHDVHTAAKMGWAALRNGMLLARAAAHGFDAMLTTDRGFKHQQNLHALPVAVIVMLAKTNRLADLLPLAESVGATIATLAPRTFVEVGPSPR